MTFEEQLLWAISRCCSRRVEDSRALSHIVHTRMSSLAVELSAAAGPSWLIAASWLASAVAEESFLSFDLCSARVGSR